MAGSADTPARRVRRAGTAGGPRGRSGSPADDGAPGHRRRPGRAAAPGKARPGFAPRAATARGRARPWGTPLRSSPDSGSGSRSTTVTRRYASASTRAASSPPMLAPSTTAWSPISLISSLPRRACCATLVLQPRWPVPAEQRLLPCWLMTPSGTLGPKGPVGRRRPAVRTIRALAAAATRPWAHTPAGRKGCTFDRRMSGSGWMPGPGQPRFGLSLRKLSPSARDHVRPGQRGL